MKAEAFENRLALGLRDVDADEPLDLAVGELDLLTRFRRIARHDQSRRLAAAEVHDEVRRELFSRDAEIGIDAALKTIARIGDDAELASGLGDVGGVPQRAFDQHVARVFIAARKLAAHHPGQQLHAVVVGR